MFVSTSSSWLEDFYFRLENSKAGGLHALNYEVLTYVYYTLERI